MSQSDPSEKLDGGEEIPSSVKMAAILPTRKTSPLLKSGDKSCKKIEDALTCELMGLMREVRADIQNVRVSLVAINEKSKISKSDERAKQLKIAWDENKPIIDENLKPITDLLEKFSPDVFANEYAGQCLYDWFGDEVTHIQNEWDRFSRLWKTYCNSQDDLLGKLDELDQLLCSIILVINRNTIPERVGEHLETLWPGEPLDFYDNFNDELCNKEDGLKILKFIETHPCSVSGIVDSTKGVIYKVDPRLWRRSFSIVMVGILALFGLVIARTFAWALLTTHYPVSIAIPNTMIANVAATTVDFSTANASGFDMITYVFCICYLFIIAGSVVHVLVCALKQLRTAQDGNVLAVEGWFDWFHIKEISNWAAVITLWIGLAGMIFVLKTTDYVTAFFVGYSVDSFVDLFLTRFADTVTTKNDDITKKISQTAAASTQ